MRAWPVFGAAVLVCACGQSGEQESVSAPAPFKGRGVAVSDTALNVTGDIDVAEDTISFASGLSLATDSLSVRGAESAIRRNGPSYVAIAPETADVELRWIGAITAPGEGAGSLCADNVEPQFVALMRNAQHSHLFVAVFSGPDEPGPEAEQSAVCGAYAYEIESESK